MLQFDEYKVKLNNLKPELDELGQALGLEAAERELEMLESESASDGFWNNLEKAQKIQQRIKQLHHKVDGQKKRLGEWEDLLTLCEMGNEEEDESLVPELEEGFNKLTANMEEARLSTLFTGEYDDNNVVLAIHAGAGVDGQHHVVVVVLAGKQGGQTGFLHVGGELVEALLQLGDQGLVLLLVAHLAEGQQVLPLAQALLLAVHLVVELLDALLNLLGLLQIVPKAVRGTLRLQHFQLPLRGFQTKGLTQFVQLGLQVIEFYLVLIKLKHECLLSSLCIK